MRQPIDNPQNQACTGAMAAQAAWRASISLPALKRVELVLAIQKNDTNGHEE
jgi:hypothetical protein